MKNRFFVYIIIVVLVGCGREEETIIPDKFYSIPLKTIKDSNISSAIAYDIFIKKGCAYPEIRRFSGVEKTLKFKSSDIEYEYIAYDDPKELKNRYNKLYKYLLGFKFDSLSNSDEINYRGFYLKWRNNSIIADGARKTKWGIGKNTDTVFTNLPKIMVKKIYPKFSGVVKKKNIDKIVRKIKYSIITHEAFKDIYFIQNCEK